MLIFYAQEITNAYAPSISADARCDAQPDCSFLLWRSGPYRLACSHCCPGRHRPPGLRRLIPNHHRACDAPHHADELAQIGQNRASDSTREHGLVGNLGENPSRADKHFGVRVTRHLGNSPCRPLSRQLIKALKASAEPTRKKFRHFCRLRNHLKHLKKAVSRRMTEEVTFFEIKNPLPPWTR